MKFVGHASVFSWEAKTMKSGANIEAQRSSRISGKGDARRSCGMSDAVVLMWRAIVMGTVTMVLSCIVESPIASLFQDVPGLLTELEGSQQNRFQGQLLVHPDTQGQE